MDQTAINVEQHHFCFETLSNELRLHIVELLQEKGTLNVSQIAKATKAERSRVSHALQILRNCRLVVQEKQGREMRYKLDVHTPMFTEHKGNLFSLMESHARTYCPKCPKRGGRKPFQ